MDFEIQKKEQVLLKCLLENFAHHFKGEQCKDNKILSMKAAFFLNGWI